MICPNCQMETAHIESHQQQPWICISVLQDRNKRLANRILELEEQVAILACDLHATEAILAVETHYSLTI